MQRNVLFRGCTRPAMFLGVPYMPFFVVTAAITLISFWVQNMFLLLLLPVAIFVMRQMARRDEMIFRLLGLRLQARMKVRNLDHHDGMWVFTPNTYREPGKPKGR